SSCWSTDAGRSTTAQAAIWLIRVSERRRIAGIAAARIIGAPIQCAPMELIAFFWDLLVHLDRHLAALLQEYGIWIYALLFLIVFCETGLVVTPFLPGDSLLFVAGALWAAAGMDPRALAATLIAAALSGHTVTSSLATHPGP